MSSAQDTTSNETSASEVTLPPAQTATSASNTPSTQTPSGDAANSATPVQSSVSAASKTTRALSDGEIMVQEALERYAVAMAPGKPLSNEQGATLQVGLYRVLVNVLNRPGPEFVPLWTLILAFAHAHAKDVFNPRYLHRFWSYLKLTPNELRSFERILNLISVTANPQMRSLGIKQVDLKIVLKYLAHPNIVQNIRAYYGLV